MSLNCIRRRFWEDWLSLQQSFRRSASPDKSLGQNSILQTFHIIASKDVLWDVVRGDSWSKGPGLNLQWQPALPSEHEKAPARRMILEPPPQNIVSIVPANKGFPPLWRHSTHSTDPAVLLRCTHQGFKLCHEAGQAGWHMNTEEKHMPAAAAQQPALTHYLPGPTSPGTLLRLAPMLTQQILTGQASFLLQWTRLLQKSKTVTSPAQLPSSTSVVRQVKIWGKINRSTQAGASYAAFVIWVWLSCC